MAFPELAQPSSHVILPEALGLHAQPSMRCFLSVTFPLGRLPEPLHPHPFNSLSTESLCLSYFCLWDDFVMSVLLHQTLELFHENPVQATNVTHICNFNFLVT